MAPPDGGERSRPPVIHYARRRSSTATNRATSRSNGALGAVRPRPPRHWRLPRLATPGLPKTGLVRARACQGTDTRRRSTDVSETLLVHAREARGLRRREVRCASGDRNGGFGRPVLYLLGEMPEELAQRVGAADGHVAGTHRWHGVAVTNPMLLLKLETPRGEGTRPTSVGSVPGRGEARSRRLSEPDGSDRKRQKDTSRLAHQSRAQAPVPGGARAPR